MADKKREASTRDVVPGFGAAIRSRREAAGLSLAALGERCGSHFTTISKLENNQRTPSLRLAADIASALGVTIDVLMLDAARQAGGKKSEKS